MAIESGQVAPAFSADVTDGSTITLESLSGKRVVLYFYPKDDTPGCTVEACDFRDNMARIAGHGAVILGVSPDSVKKHVKFTDKFSLPFPLLADEDHAMAEAYGVWIEKSMYGKKYMGIERTTFLIDERGIVRNVWSKVKVEGHVTEVIKAIEAL